MVCIVDWEIDANIWKDRNDFFLSAKLSKKCFCLWD